MRRLLALSLVTLAGVALAGPASATAPERLWISGPFADGVLSDFREDAPAGTVFTDTSIIGVDSVTRDDGTKAAGATVSIAVFRYTADDALALYEGDAPATVVVDKKFATARVTATDVPLVCDDSNPQPCVAPPPVDVDARFTATGPSDKNVVNFHFLFEGQRLVIHSIQRARPATFTATFDGAPVPGTPIGDPAIGDGRSGTICRGTGC